MYLKTILMIGKDNGRVRNIDIAMELGYSKPSVTVAIRKLAADDMVRINQDRSIVLTDKGKLAAEENVCSMEHCVTDELFETIQKLYIRKGMAVGK